MTKFIDNLGLKRLVTKIAEAVGNGTWLPVRKGEGEGSVVMGEDTTAVGSYSHAEGSGTMALGNNSHAEGNQTNAASEYSHAEGFQTNAYGEFSHAEGYNTNANGKGSHAQGSYNYNDPSFIYMVGVGGNSRTKKNASAIYVGRDEGTEEVDPSNPKNGYQYLLGVGGYQGQDIAEDMRSVQEVIADLEKGVAATETMTVEDIREIMSA